MFIIAEPYARFEASAKQSDLEQAAARLEEFGEKALQDYFDERYEVLRITVVVRIETGSTRVWVTVGSVVTALTLYGNIRQSVDYLVHDAKHIGNVVLPHAGDALGFVQPPEYRQRRTGVPGRINKLFQRVERGEISADEATSKALGILYEYSDSETIRTVPELAGRLADEFAEAERERAPLEQPPRRLPVQPVALPSPVPRERRRGVIASRDPTTGELLVRTY